LLSNGSLTGEKDSGPPNTPSAYRPDFCFYAKDDPRGRKVHRNFLKFGEFQPKGAESLSKL
jgi:hypothetical protein